MEITRLFCLPFLLLISNCFSLITASKSFFNLTTDESALIAFKNSIITSNPNSILLKNWSIQTPICIWIGVSCSPKHHRVISLNLSGYDLQGTIPPHLGNLTFLRFLDVSSNNFTGSLPSELSKLRRLKDINVDANNFTGEIPSWFGALSGLQNVYLSNNRFSGNIPEEIGNLSYLELVRLEGNELIGFIPNSIFNISSLLEINLGRNMLSGKLPNNMCSNTPKLRKFTVYWNEIYGEIPKNISKCKELVVLQVQVNNFSGKIPSEIGGLSKLEALYLWSNQFKGGIPKQLGNVTSLIILNVESNNLTGELPEELSNLASLRGLLLSANSLTGSIPPAIFNISALEKLELSFNLFYGTLPSSMGISLFNLRELYLQGNSFSGPVPSSINNASQLLIFTLQLNSFSGLVPNFPSLRLLTEFYLSDNNLTATPDMEFLSSLSNSQSLEVFQVSMNPLTGVLPASLGNLSKFLESFDAYGTSISGVIPSEIGNLTSLIEILLNDNDLSGMIPTTMRNLKRLGRLALGNNHLQGSIPADLCHMSSLVELQFSNNVLEGPIPECLGEMQSLRLIYFDSNMLNSTIPSNFWNLKDLIAIILSSNYLSGQISPHIEKLKAANRIYLSYNLFTGDIPSSIDGCQSLEYVNFSNNKLGGSIPQSFGNMRGLRELDLSSNSLSGLIPESLQDLKVLEYLNVSNNKLEGEIPNGGAFANFTAQSFVHNAALCGAARFEVPPCLDVHVGSRSKSNVGRLMKYIFPSVFSTMALVIIVVLVIRRWRRIVAPIAVDTSSLGVAWRVISYIELSRATDSFSETNLIGRGSFGSVYRGALSDGLNIAVKVFSLELEGANKSFETESRILSTIRHRNLIRIIGCCTNGEFKALILEFMPNGSLEKLLYSENSSLDILQLLNISIDVALALEYLHDGNAFHVVHCDIKPSNVLLDEDMTARVADFGVAKLFEEGKTMMQTSTLATIGYAAPEYGSEGIVSTSADVYSYGILLLEMFTGKRPTDDMFEGGMSLKEWVNEALEANAMNQVLAPCLVVEEDGHFVAKEKYCMECVFHSAMKCLAILPSERINMTEAAATLHRIKVKVVRARAIN